MAKNLSKGDIILIIVQSVVIRDVHAGIHRAKESQQWGAEAGKEVGEGIKYGKAMHAGMID